MSTTGPAVSTVVPISGRIIMSVFFMQAFAGGLFFVRIPDLQTSLGLSKEMLGLVVTGNPIGSLIATAVASGLIERFGTRNLLIFTLPASAVFTFMIAIAPGPVGAFAALFAIGFAFALADMSMNVEADRIEAATGARIMNRCHGFWSLGMLSTSLAGAAARGLDIGMFWHFGGLLLPIVAVTFWLTRSIEAMPPRLHGNEARGRALPLPNLATFALLGFSLAGVMLEMGTRTWSVIFMRDNFDAPAFIEALTLPAFLAMLAAGRMMGDRLVMRFGAVRVAAALLITALIGLLLVVFSANLVQAIMGFGLMGIGVCITFPLMVSAATRLGGRPASENVTAVTMLIGLLMLFAPGLMGVVAQHWGLRTSFAALIPVVLIALALVRSVKPKHSFAAQASPAS